MLVITSALDSRDGVSIGGKRLHHTFRPMINNDLTLDQLQTISGGRVTRCGTVHTFLTAKLGGSADPGGDDI